MAQRLPVRLALVVGGGGHRPGHCRGQGADSKLTLVELLVLLCRRCHHDHHHGRFTVTIDDDSGAFVFSAPDGQPLQRPSTVTGSATDLVEENTKAGVTVDPDRCRSRWDGSRLDTKWIPGPKSATVAHGHVPRNVSGGFEPWSPDDWRLDTTDVDQADTRDEADARPFLAAHHDTTDQVRGDEPDDP